MEQIRNDISNRDEPESKVREFRSSKTDEIAPKIVNTLIMHLSLLSINKQ